MKKKMLLFAALVAASGTAFISCSSSDEDLLAQATVAPAAGESVASETGGIPLVVEASTNDGTRATMITGSNFTSFQLWAFDQREGAIKDVNNVTLTDNCWVGNAYDEESLPQTGMSMEKTGEPLKWNAPAQFWPKGAANSKFYAISATTDSKNSLAPHMTKTGAYFDYTVAEDADDQEDLLVGTTTISPAGADGVSNTDDDGKVSIGLTHALSKLNFSFKMNPTDADINEWQGASDQGLCVMINQIEINGIKRTGKYTFGGAGWSSDDDADKTIIITPDQDIQVVVGFKYVDSPDEAYVVDDYGVTTVNADALISDPGLVLPQEVENIWTPNVDNLTTGAYLRLKAKCIIYAKGEAVSYFTNAVDDLSNELFHTNDGYWKNQANEIVAREDGVILDFSKLPADHEIDLQVRTCSDGEIGGSGTNVFTDTGYGYIYKPLGTGTFEFKAGVPRRFTVNLLTGLNDQNHSPWGDFGQAGASRQFGDLMTEE